MDNVWAEGKFTGIGPSTFHSARYQDLLTRHAGATQIVGQPCPGLVELIEAGDFESPALRELLARLCQPLRAADVDTVLMGCTHYPLIQPLIQAELGPDVTLLNIESAVAQQAARLWASLAVPIGPTALRLETTGSAQALTQFVRQALGWNQVIAKTLIA